MLLKALGLYRTLDLKFIPMDSPHFKNTLKRTINCPATRADMNEPGTQQGCGVGVEAIFNGWSRGPTSFRWWSRSLERGFLIHRDSLLGKRVIQIIQCFFLIFWTKLFCRWSQKLPDVGAGAKNF